VPGGYAHGFLALADDTRVQYKVTDFWSRDSEHTLGGTIRHWQSAGRLRLARRLAVRQGSRRCAARPGADLSVKDGLLRVLITGASGQLGKALVTRRRRAGTQVLYPRRARHRGPAAVQIALRDFQPNLVLNAAAFTAVDAAERAPEAAARTNTRGPRCWPGLRAPAVHGSRTSPRTTCSTAPRAPVRHERETPSAERVRRTKLEGEIAVLKELPQASTVVRASWLYSAHGGFAARMLALMVSRPQLSIVADRLECRLRRADWRRSCGP